MTGHHQLRQLFNKFWLDLNHKEIPAIPLVPKDDPTTLFTGSGMQQLIPYLLGETHPLGKRLYNIQPCFRSQDIEEVGDNRHDTFFEMMGNWSLGDYFKKDQLAWFWDFLTNKLNLPKEKLYVSVFSGTDIIPPDEESYKTWIKLGLPDEKIFKYGSDNNWWSRAGAPENMPAGEPGGPDSEVFYEFDIVHDQRFGKECHPNCQCGKYLEIGNSVFMEYRKENNSNFTPLPNKNVDFGAGLERILAALNNNPDIFTTDLYLPIIKGLQQSLNVTYSDEITKTVLRIIADHTKAACFLIKDGVLTSNKEQGYFLRRLVRRMVVKARNLQGRQVTIDDFGQAINAVIEIYDGIYFDKQIDNKKIKSIIEEEINRFGKTLEKGLKEIGRVEKIDGKIAFDFYQSYGFPLEIIEEIFKEKGQKIDKVQFEKEFKKHKDLSRQSATCKFKGGLADQSEQTVKYHTATHLFHQALFDVLGNEVRQEGSNITAERLRFDFYSVKKPTEEDLQKVDKIVNEQIKKALPVHSKIIPKDEALKIGAKSFFREKYPDVVKVYFIEGFSKEFCGGPHVKNTSEIGKIKIFKFEKIGSNLYRLYAKQ